MRLSSKLLLFVAIAYALALALAAGALAEPSPQAFELIPGSFHVTPSTDQAAAHEDLTTSFDFAHETATTADTYNDVRTIIVNLPPGFIGNNTAVPTCTNAQLLSGKPGGGFAPACPIASQVGVIGFEVANLGAGRPPAQFVVPLYNLEVTSFGIVAEFGFKTAIFTQVLQVRVRPGDSGLTITTPNISQVEPRNISVTVWGLPAAHEHDAQRGLFCGDGSAVPATCVYEFGGPQEARIPVKPYLSNPTSCGTTEATIEADSWETPNTWSKGSASIGPIGECERVPFRPSIEAQPTTRSAESPSGLDVSLIVPQSWENPNSISTANVADTTLTLPVGYTINPGAGSGLGTCTPAQYEAETSSSPPGAGCPQESKIGTVEVETPVLAEKLTGNVYVATPFDNKFGSPEHPGGSLLALYILVKDPARGIIVKLAGKIEPNLVTGQLVTTFDENPQVPFSKFTLKLLQAATSPLISPPACGFYTAEASFTPWSEPLVPRLVNSPPFQIESGIDGSPCPSGGVPPFKPQAIAGTENNAAGGYSPFYLRILREDGEQEITGFSTTLPAGLTGNLTGIPFCPDADIEAAKEVSGAQELSDPSCPAAQRSGAYDRRRGRRDCAGADPREAVLGGAVSRRAAVIGIDHQRRGRPVRPRHGRDPLRAEHQPDDGTGRSQRERIGPDSAHHPRHRRARP